MTEWSEWSSCHQNFEKRWRAFLKYPVHKYSANKCQLEERRNCSVHIKWQTAGQINWSNDCDKFGSDIKQLYVRSEQCGPECLNHVGCTHFFWTNEWNNEQTIGKCILKGGAVTINDFKYIARCCLWYSQNQLYRL